MQLNDRAKVNSHSKWLAMEVEDDLMVECILVL